MHFNLRVLNLLHSLCDEASETPDLFRLEKYQVRSVEPVFKVAKDRNCNPECILTSSPSGNTIVLESKGGTGNSKDQIDRYGQVSPAHLLGGGFDLKKSDVRTVDVVLICERSTITRQIATLDEAKSDIAVISYHSGSGELKLCRGKLSNPRLHSGLSQGLSIPWPPIPHDYIPFDCNSTDIEIAQAIVPHMGTYVMRKVKHFDSSDVCRDSTPSWSVLPPAHKQALSTRIDGVLEQIVKMGFSGQFAISSKSKAKRIIIDVTPIAAVNARRDPNQYARKLNRWQEEVVLDLIQMSEQKEREGQMKLFKGAALPDEPVHRRHRRR